MSFKKAALFIKRKQKRPKKFSSTSFQSAMSLLVFVCCCCGPITVTAVLVFDSSAQLSEVLIPADAAIGSVIYRIIASDTSFDFPLKFQVKETSTVDIDSLNCTKFNSVCQANLILKKKLEIGRFYDFKVSVANQRGQVQNMNCSFKATNATTPFDKIFPGATTLLTISENARRNTELGSIIAKGNPNRTKAVYLELYGALQFGIHQRLISEKDAEGTVILLSPLDYETKSVHHLTILANNPWTKIDEDTRNIAGWNLLVAIIDEQDTPPIFTIAPPTTTLSSNLKPGDTILRVHAEDGDRGQPRPIRYSLDSQDQTSLYFHILEKTGELTLARPVSDITSNFGQGQAIPLKITAEEVRSNPQEAPSQSTTIQLALISPGLTHTSTTFGASEYHALLDENAPVGTVIDLPQTEITTESGNVVTLELENNNGTFEILPSVVEGLAQFEIRVHDNHLLDYEARRYVECYIVARELGRGDNTTKAKLTVILNDVNDNPPQFVSKEFKGSVGEDAVNGTEVLVVEATDVDREPGSKIKYLKLTGVGSELFHLNPETGLITVAVSKKLDAETYPQIRLEVQAADENGEGLVATSEVVITLLDVNDNAPEFEKDVYEFILNTDRQTFTTQAFIKAFDRDISSPNNEVKYELLSTNKNLIVDKNTGEISVQNNWESEEMVTLKARAYDQGIPRMFSDCEIRIYPPESKSRKITFILPGKNLDRRITEKTLTELTGGNVTVNEIKPYKGYVPGVTYVTRDKNGDLSVVEATIHYTKDSVVDINRLQQILDDQYQRQQNVQLQNQPSNPNTIIKEREETIINKSSSGDLWWLLILFIVIAIIAAIILIICCICHPCPLYIPPKRRKVRNSGMIDKLVIKGSGEGRESKSVQVAEWFGRKEAWSAEKVMIDGESESLRRHEMERGSDRGARHVHVRHQQAQHSQSMNQLNQQEVERDQLYIREGNADILRLVTRAGGEPQKNATMYVDQQHPHYLVDSGKDILMRRFIDQQQAEATRVPVLLPNAINKLQTEQEFLESSLRQQNAMLRQLILDRERDLRLETQSLPAGTQTDQDRGTQTEPQYLRPPRRKVQSDLDISDGSDEEIAIIKARAKRRHRVMKTRKIKTPIQEESELEAMEKYEKPYKPQSVDKSTEVDSQPRVKHTRTSELRQRRASSEASSARRSRSSKSGLRKEVLKEISASLNQTEDESDSYYRKRGTSPEDLYSEDSLEEISPGSGKTTSSGKRGYSHSRSQSTDRRSYSRSDILSRTSRQRPASLDRRSHRDGSALLDKNRHHGSQSPTHKSKRKPSQSSDFQQYRSELDLRRIDSVQESEANKLNGKSQSHVDLTSAINKTEKNEKKAKKPQIRKTSRYMEWYKKSENSDTTLNKKEREKSDVTSVDSGKLTKPLVESRLFKETVSSSNKKADGNKSKMGPEHPLLQHSEHRFEAQYPKKRPEEDADSGIVLTKPEMAQKKSIFTIAYNDMHTSQLRPDSSVNTP